jgi:hypothetical protein
MNKNIKNLFFAFVACVSVLVTSCGEKTTLAETVTPASGARVKFMNGVAAGNPLVVTQNGSKWSAILVASTKYTDSIIVGALYPSIDYATFPAGSVKFQAKYPLSVNPKDTVVSELTQNLENDKYYFLLAADSFPTPKLYMIQDERNDDTRKSNKTYFRFSNFLLKTPTTGFDLYLARQPTKPFATLKYSETSQYVEFEPSSTVPDTVFIRVPGTTTNRITLALGASRFAANRSAIVLFRGIDGGTGTKAPTFQIVTTN